LELSYSARGNVYCSNFFKGSIYFEKVTNCLKETKPSQIACLSAFRSLS